MSKFNAFFTQTINIYATHTSKTAVLTLVYPCSCVSLLAVVAERPWFHDYHGDTVMCWMQFLAGRPQHAKSHSVSERRTDGSIFLVIFLDPQPSVRRF
jgi:hypothetical protein